MALQRNNKTIKINEKMAKPGVSFPASVDSLETFPFIIQ
jgi:hypothetical protein